MRQHLFSVGQWKHDKGIECEKAEGVLMKVNYIAISRERILHMMNGIFR